MEERPLRKSEVLAIENIKRIADQIRSERNDALALAQEMRDRVEAAVTGLGEIKSLLGQAMPADAVSQKIDSLLSQLTRR
jgi:hypothetical protein